MEDIKRRSRRYGNKHDREEGKLLKRLEDKCRYDVIEPEVPVYWHPSKTQKAGQLDIITITHWDYKLDVFEYWELKTGHDEEESLRTAKKQFAQVYAALKKSPFPVENHTMRFIYYNPTTKSIRHYRPKHF